ncbi:ABC transporter ATP-binding protein [Legionella taurinensis]|uniref:ABC transporter ATP-binding protein n=1 Tax=Legionella taurinensis TaxID=70611 RepID=A0AB38N2J3_9GAMM|nr:hypothetical protein DB744_13165 [Legionella taurinensis]PUT40100.1 hypothetical protein DB746_12565 [Legionella taurinensis]PUT42252.1 hypothetical protein DB743_13050 [Legionella taurinensis]PUT46024.1 hypothetical protein DB745_12020 [Legionella taurinensis]TID31644.1 ABC transporter ATP-binding protein [Legionella taurinensis]
MRGSLKFGIIVSILSILAILGFAALSFFAAPLVLTVIAGAFFAGGMVFLMAMGYGIFNDLLGAKSNLPYFMLGHQPQQHSMIQSNKPAAQGIAWGIAAVAPLAFPAAILFFITALVAGFFVPTALFVLPVMAIVIPLIVIIADVVARRKKKIYTAGTDEYQLAHQPWEAFQGSLNEYQVDGLMEMSNTVEEKAAWLANSDRNVIGFKYVPILAVISLVTFATLTGVSTLLPAVMFGAIMSTILPVSAGVLIALAITAALIYLAVNHKKQDDNQYKLDFPNADAPDEPKSESTQPTVNPLAPVLTNKKTDGEQASANPTTNEIASDPSPTTLAELVSSTNSPVYGKKTLSKEEYFSDELSTKNGYN